MRMTKEVKNMIIDCFLEMSPDQLIKKAKDDYDYDLTKDKLHFFAYRQGLHRETNVKKVKGLSVDTYILISKVNELKSYLITSSPVELRIRAICSDIKYEIERDNHIPLKAYKEELLRLKGNVKSMNKQAIIDNVCLCIDDVFRL